jgi:eIF-2B alpha/beta/delta-like uncharacterized protein
LAFLFFYVTGAPLIAIVAVLGLAVDLHTNPATKKALDDMEDTAVLAFIKQKMEYLKTSRPTAVNLSNALEEARQVMTTALETGDASKSQRERLLQAVLKYAEFMLERDVSDNKAIGKFGAEAILAKTGKEKVNMVTICNTGSLATAGYGTALGVVRSLHEGNQLETITALETRPYNQGSRLTAFEIMEEKMPGGRLICDSAAGALMRVSKTIALFHRQAPSCYWICVTDRSLLVSFYCHDRPNKSTPAWLAPIVSVPMAIPRTRLEPTILLWLPLRIIFPFTSLPQLLLSTFY